MDCVSWLHQERLIETLIFSRGLGFTGKLPNFFRITFRSLC